MLIPFYIGGRGGLRVVIVGGGYAGLAALEALRAYRRDAEITLIDPGSSHLKITHLHEALRWPARDFKVSFRTLERRFNARHIQASLDFDQHLLGRWNHERKLTVGDQTIAFDFLLVAVGAPSKPGEKGKETLDLSDLIACPGPQLLENHLASAGSTEPWLTVVGSGATGVQFLFEVSHYLQARERPCRIRLVDGGAAPLQQFDSKIGHYVRARLEQRGIEYLPNYRFLSQESGVVIVEDQEVDEAAEFPSALSLLFIGKESVFKFDTNWFGQVVTNGTTLDRIFAAGDCSRYRGIGSNAMSAQSAVRKGRLVARNILRAAGPLRIMEPYIHRDLGYVISMGPSDAVGWLGLESNIVAGSPAQLAKEVVEAQYDLLLTGIDTYVL